MICKPRLTEVWGGLRRSYDTPAGQRLVLVAGLLLTVAAASLVYYRFLDQWFFRDDIVWLGAAKNPHVLESIKSAFEFPRGPTPYWRPLADFYFFSMYRLFSLDAFPYHLANLVLHAATAAATVMLIRRVTRSLAAGILAGLLFAVAPAYGTGVVWISTVGSLMAALLSVTTLVLFLRFWEGAAGRRTLVLATVTFTAALFTMEASASLPVFLVVLGLAVKLPSDRPKVVAFARAVLPFVALAAAYGALQLSQSQIGSSTQYQLDWQAAVRLGERLRWLSLPLSTTDYGSWVGGAQWAALATFSLAATVALLRRQWAMPALFACALIALVPSSFLAGAFFPRWVYLASIPWAGFIAALTVTLIQWLSVRHVIAGAAAIVVVLAGLGAALLPRDTEVQRWMSGQAAQTEGIKDALEDDCPTLGQGDTVYALSLPLTDPSHLVLGLIRLVRPDPKVARVGGEGFDPLSPGDCVIEWRGGGYRGTAGAEYDAGPFWSVTVAAPCPQALPWQWAGLLVDDLAIISGRVTRVDRHDDASVLHVGDPNKFRVIIPAHRQASSPDPEQSYLGENICVRGVIRGFLGQTIMTVRSADTIAVEEVIEVAGRLLDLDRAGYARLAKNSVDGSFAAEELREEILTAIDDWETRGDG